MGHSGPFDERAGRDHDHRTRRNREADLRRCRRQGCRRHLGQGSIFRGRGSFDARGHEPPLCRTAQGQGRGRGQSDAVRREPQILAGVPLDRNFRKAVGSRDQRACARRRVRTHAVVPLPCRGGKSQNAPRAAGSQGRAFSRRRRHPAGAAHRAAAGCDADAVEGRGGQPGESQGVEADRRRRSRWRSRQGGKRLDQGRRQGGRALG